MKATPALQTPRALHPEAILMLARTQSQGLWGLHLVTPAHPVRLSTLAR